MKREVIYRTDAMAAVGSLKGLSDTDKSKAMQAVLDVPAVQTCEDAVSRQHAIEALMRRDKELRNINWYDKPFAEGECKGIDYALEIVNALPSVQPTQSNASNALKTLDCIDRQAAIDKLDPLFESLAIDKIKALPTAQPQTEEDCDTCKHGYFGDRQCDNCRVRYPSHYEREEEHHGSDGQAENN